MSNAYLRKSIASVNLDQLKSYLLFTGWFKDSDLRNVATIWHRSDNVDDAELLFPVANLARDFDDRLVDLILTLSEYEKRSSAEMISIISNFFSDLIRVRIIHSDVESGTIPLNDGVMLYEKARELMISAALSTISKKRHFVGSRPPETTEFIDQVRLGQTEIGSYIINIISPIQTSSGSQTSSDTTSFSRMVTHTLSTGLGALNRATKDFSEQSDISIFNDVVKYGASANMCEALIGLAGQNKQRSFIISVKPSSSQEMPSINQPLEFSFDIKSINVLEKAVNFFKENYILPNKTIVGYVKRLDRKQGSQVGSITVICQVNDFEKNIVIDLEDSDYIEAIHAHEQKQLVSCHGDLHVSTRTAHLLSPNDFKVIRNGELF